MELVLPSKKLHNVKFDFKTSLLDQEEEGGLFDMKGSATLVYNDDKTIKYDGSIRHSGIFDEEHAHEGDTKIALTILKLPPLIMSDSFKYMPDSEKIKIIRNTNVNYGGKELSLDIDNLEFDHAATYFKINGKAATPYETMRHIDYSLNHEVTFAARRRLIVV